MFRKNRQLFIEVFLLAVLFITRFLILQFNLFVKSQGILLLIVDCLYVILFLVCGFPLLKDAVEEAVEEKNYFSEEMLMLIGAIAALLTGEVAEAATIIVLFTFGEKIADIQADRSRGEIKWLLDLHVRKCKVIRDGEQTEALAGDVREGETVVLSPGDIVPFDCKIVDGKSFFDTSSITGESEPRTFESGDEILSGFVLLDGMIKASVLKNCANSTVANILKMIDEVSQSKSKQEKFVSKFAKIYTPLVLIFAVLVALVPPVVTLRYDFSFWIYKAAGILVASCPCAIVVSVPLSYFVGSAALARQKVFVKNSQILDTIRKVNVFCFDKTGTLTNAKFEIVGFETSIDENHFKKIVVSAESYSKHPIAKSICSLWSDFNSGSDVSNYREIAGMGIEFDFCGEKYNILSDKNRQSDDNANTIIILSDEKKNELGRIWLCDSIRQDAEKVMEFLKKSQIRCVMLTGDRQAVAKKISCQLQMDDMKSQMLPQEKLNEIRQLQNKGNIVGYVGDGINDVAAMTGSDVGIAMGGIASDSIRDAADIILEGDNLSGLILAKSISVRTYNVVLQNIIVSLFFKFAVIVLSLSGLTYIWLNVFADSGILILSIVNALRIRSGLKKAKPALRIKP